MTKYKLVGISNLLFGLIETIYPLFILLFTIPKFIALFSEFNSPISSLYPTYFVISIILLLGLGNLYFALKLLLKAEEKKDMYFKYGLILIIISLLSGGVLVSIFSFSLVFPIYNLTSHL